MMNLADTRRAPVSPARLAQIAIGAAGQPEHWNSLIRYDAGQRWYHRLAHDDDHEVWLLSWLPGQGTGFHDHGASCGAFTVVLGCLRERNAPGGRPQRHGRALGSGTVRSFGADYVHDVRNDSAGPAISIHAYSPPLASMRRFHLGQGGLLQATAEDRSW